MTKIRVHLAEAPTDVLVWLVSQPADHWWTPSGVADGAAPADAGNALASTCEAMRLLLDGHLIESRSFDGIWMFRASDTGRAAVEAGASA